MRFLLEAADKYNTIAEAKAVEEKESGVRYNDLDRNSEFDFINHVLDRLNNSDNLQQARDTYIDIIREKGWDSSRNPIIPFIEKIPEDLSSNIVKLISNLIDDRKINIYRDSDWLFNSSLYDRRIEDQAYSIKALVLASNPQLQQDKRGKNKFNSKNSYLIPADLMKNDIILPVNDIIAVLDIWQDISPSTPDKNMQKATSSKKSQKATSRKKSRKTASRKKSQKVDLADKEISSIKQDTISALRSMGMSKSDAAAYVDEFYTHDDMVAALVARILKGSKN